MANTVVQSNPPVPLLLGLAKNGGIQKVVINGGAVIGGLTVIWIQSLFYVSAICKYVEYIM